MPHRRRVERGDEVAGDDTRAAALALLLSRFSVSPKYLGEPGPTDDGLLTMALAALRAPDHDKLVPFRFVRAGIDRRQSACAFDALCRARWIPPTGCTNSRSKRAFSHKLSLWTHSETYR